MEDLINKTMDFQQYQEYKNNNSNIMEIGMFGDLDYAVETAIQIEECPAKRGLNDDISTEIILIISEDAPLDRCTGLNIADYVLVVKK